MRSGADAAGLMRFKRCLPGCGPLVCYGVEEYPPVGGVGRCAARVASSPSRDQASIQAVCSLFRMEMTLHSSSSILILPSVAVTPVPDTPSALAFRPPSRRNQPAPPTRSLRSGGMFKCSVYSAW